MAEAVLERLRIKYFEELIEFFEKTRFFKPSEELTKLIVARAKHLRNRRRGVFITEQSAESPNSEAISLQEKLIGEQIYHYLAMISKSPQAINGNKLDLQEIISFGVGKSVGLSSENEDKQLLLALSSEFSKWIEQEGGFQTGWGEIHNAGEGSILTERYNIAEDAINNNPPNAKGRRRSLNQQSR